MLLPPQPRLLSCINAVADVAATTVAIAIAFVKFFIFPLLELFFIFSKNLIYQGVMLHDSF
jgi:hypothetical protein